MKAQPGKYRRNVEIYFVLYLAAMLLLLPDEKGTQDSSDSSSLVSALLQTGFSIVPEKNYLSARLQRDSSGNMIVSIDSLNTIYPVGNVQDIRYEFFIEDQSLQETLRITAGSSPSPRVFRVTQDPVSGNATFVWQPPANEQYSRTFTVRVVARAKPTVPAALMNDDNLRQQLETIINNEETALTARTRFDVAITFGGNNGPIAATGTGRIDTVVNMNFPPNVLQQLPPAVINGEPVFDLEFKQITMFAGQQWTNEARLYNLDLRQGLKETPRIIFPSNPNNGTAYVDRIDAANNTVVLKGTAPTSEFMRVQLVAQRSADNRQVLAEFVVRPTPMTQPDIPTMMYPKQQYVLDPQLPMLTGQSVSAVLYDEDGERYTSKQGEEFRFIPQESDIGKKLRFERYVGGKKVGESYIIRVIDYPPPRVISINAEQSRLVVKTQGFGPKTDISKRVKLLTEDRENCRDPREIYGNYTYDTTSDAHIQMFELPKVDASKPASCTVTAVDDRGRRSDPVTFKK